MPPCPPAQPPLLMMDIKIGQFHVRVQECNYALIAVTSRLDAVVACINVLQPMENRRCTASKLMLWLKYTEYFKFAEFAEYFKSHR